MNTVQERDSLTLFKRMEALLFNISQSLSITLQVKCRPHLCLINRRSQAMLSAWPQWCNCQFTTTSPQLLTTCLLISLPCLTLISPQFLMLTSNLRSTHQCSPLPPCTCHLLKSLILRDTWVEVDPNIKCLMEASTRMTVKASHHPMISRQDSLLLRDSD